MYKEEIEPDVYTPLGIPVVLNGYNPDLELLDQMYIDMLSCIGIPDDPYLYIGDFIVYIEDDQLWDCPHPPDGEMGTCGGQYYHWTKPRMLKVHEMLTSFPHEFGHWWAHEKMGIGAAYSHSQCSFAMNCGTNSVGKYYYEQYLQGDMDENWEPKPKCICIQDIDTGFYKIIDEDNNGVCD